MKIIPAGCVLSAVHDTKENKTCLLSNTWVRCFIAHSRPSSQEKKCWCGTMTNIHNTLVSPLLCLTWVLLYQVVSDPLSSDVQIFLVKINQNKLTTTAESWIGLEYENYTRYVTILGTLRNFQRRSVSIFKLNSDTIKMASLRHFQTVPCWFWAKFVKEIPAI